jgi:hypothetical protein
MHRMTIILPQGVPRHGGVAASFILRIQCQSDNGAHEKSLKPFHKNHGGIGPPKGFELWDNACHAFTIMGFFGIHTPEKHDRG